MDVLNVELLDSVQSFVQLLVKTVQKYPLLVLVVWEVIDLVLIVTVMTGSIYTEIIVQVK